jgi:hypothetical protein
VARAAGGVEHEKRKAAVARDQAQVHRRPRGSRPALSATGDAREGSAAGLVAPVKG